LCSADIGRNTAMSKTGKEKESVLRFQVSEDDIYEAMKDIQGYLDITPGDLKEIYFHAYQHALDRIKNSVKAMDLMTRNVIAAFRDTPLGEVAERMALNGISGLPVIDPERHVLGVISEKDFSRHMGDCSATSLMRLIADCIGNQGCAAMTIRGKMAEDIMTAPAITIREDAVLGEITSLLARNGINRVPVVDQNGRLTGIVSRADIVRLSFEKPQ
jgi:CBS domain-containing membrane protein